MAMAATAKKKSESDRFCSSPDLLHHHPSLTKLKIGICQMRVSGEKKENLKHARSLIQVAAKQGANLVLLPEMWVCPYTEEDMAKNAEDFDDEKGASSPTLEMLSEVAGRLSITIIGGSLPERCKGELYNTCPIFGADGKLIAKHRKEMQVHLFDANFLGEFCFMESHIFAAGDKPTIVDTEVGRIGIGICHDIRFPELATFYRDKGVCLIAYPGAFNISTGESLWELVQRGRAADNQCGEIIASCGHEENVMIAEIDYSQLHILRKGLPLFKQRREDVYSQHN
ncbi:omega-amidase, chloroplastic-like isoform X2 [Senna tora]|uniref:Omega-amidase, chloroplastic-like isoform X2 n=1 Tax=Senna tora TaxID=362788 RepID=A0A834XFZ0_9FABA|nr:omega-amidase, chloroplastic-like isoform X2 [Senna tora]